MLYPGRKNRQRTWDTTLASCPICKNKVSVSISPTFQAIQGVRCETCNVTVNTDLLRDTLGELYRHRSTPTARLAALRRLLKILTAFRPITKRR